MRGLPVPGVWFAVQKGCYFENALAASHARVTRSVLLLVEVRGEIKDNQARAWYRVDWSRGFLSLIPERCAQSGTDTAARMMLLGGRPAAP
eukprot:2432062-Rhodomonas_salina.2